MAVNIVPTTVFNKAVQGDRAAAQEGFNHAYGAFLLARGSDDKDAMASAQEEGVLMYFAAMGPLVTHGEDVSTTPEFAEDLDLLARDLVYEEGIFDKAVDLMNQRDRLVADGFLVAYKRSSDGSDNLPKVVYYVDIPARAPQASAEAAEVLATSDEPSEAFVDQASRTFDPAVLGARKESVINALKSAWARIKAAAGGLKEAQTFDFAEESEAWVAEALAAEGAPVEEAQTFDFSGYDWGGEEGQTFDFAGSDEFVNEQIESYAESEEKVKKGVEPAARRPQFAGAREKKKGGGAGVAIALLAVALGIGYAIKRRKN